MKRNVVIVSVGALVFVGAALAATVVGRMAGERAGAVSQERLQLVWPSIMNMPVNDRALLVGLAMTCRVEDRPAIAGDVIECLRDAVDDEHAMLPKGVDRDSARARLEQLLRQRTA